MKPFELIFNEWKGAENEGIVFQWSFIWAGEMKTLWKAAKTAEKGGIKLVMLSTRIQICPDRILMALIKGEKVKIYTEFETCLGTVVWDGEKLLFTPLIEDLKAWQFSRVAALEGKRISIMCGKIR